MKHAGSPPHTREPPHSDRIPQLQAGITPAYAGTTYCNNLICCIRQDHPRIRGNHARRQNSSRTDGGSPPHTREPPTAITLSAVFARITPGWWRITPAYAGTTPRALSLCLPAWDHPRIRGNHSILPSYTDSYPGSPPHTREPHLHCLLVAFRFRITPAYAGTTPRALSLCLPAWDHPRIRGNHHAICDALGLYEGSPPHTREPRNENLPERVRRGITPAYAGTTMTVSPSFL